MGFEVDADVVGTGGDEAFEVVIGTVDHEVDVEEHLGVSTDGFDHGGAEGDVVNEVAVHDVEVEPFGTSVFGAVDFFFDVGEVGGEERGEDEGSVEIHG